ncbi:MAG TPA: TolC family protein [Acidobacteriota bacterium]|nr:TolC family protein [Acidobacteriota bacterium]
MRYVLVVLLLIIGATPAAARDLSLGEALTLAQQHSLALKKASAETQAARQSLQSALAERHPTLSLTALALYVDDIATLDIDLSPGPSFSRQIGTRESYQTDIRVGVPLYTGGRISAGIGGARSARDYYVALELAGLDRVRYQVRKEYLTLLAAHRLVETALASLQRTRIISTDITAMYKAGAADSVDLLQARLAVTQAQFGHERALIERRSAEIRLLVLLGLDPGEPLNLTTWPGPPVLPEEPQPVPATRPELLAADAGIRLSESRVDLAASEYLPNLSAFAGYSYGRPNLDRFNNTWNDYFTFGGQLSWSLNLFKNRSRRSAAFHGVQAARRERTRLGEQLDVQARLAYEQLKLSHIRYLSARDEYEITSESYRLACEKHKEGLLSSNRLLEIETTLTAAQSNLAAALANFYIAAAEYYYAIGSDELERGM